MKSFGIIIPSRYASTRLPGKPLEDIQGKTLIQRVVENASSIQTAEFILVATDDERIFSHVNTFGQAMMTQSNHATGTDRIRECLDHLDTIPDIIVNIQGDEPFLDPKIVLDLVACFDQPECQIATAYHTIGHEAAQSKNNVKLVSSNKNAALYFSRSVIPYDNTDTQKYKAHMGIYAYRNTILKEITALAPSSLELSESLEQLRWIQNGYAIHCVESKTPSIGIDTPEDLSLARAKFLSR